MLLALSNSALNNMIEIRHMLLFNLSSQSKRVPSLKTVFLSLYYNTVENRIHFLVIRKSDVKDMYSCLEASIRL